VKGLFGPEHGGACRTSFAPDRMGPCLTKGRAHDRIRSQVGPAAPGRDARIHGRAGAGRPGREGRGAPHLACPVPAPPASVSTTRRGATSWANATVDKRMGPDGWG